MMGNLNNEPPQTNVGRALAAWGRECPEWIKLLAAACDRTNQRDVAARIGKSSGYVSRVLARKYAGSYSEAETIVRAAFGAEEVECPLYGRIPLSACLRNRRRKQPPRDQRAHMLAATCPRCPNNTDIGRPDHAA